MATPPTFSAGAVLTAAQMNTVGQWKVGGGTYTGADPIAVTGCFTSDFTHYRVVGALYGSVATQNLALNFYTGTNTIDNAATYNVWGFRWTGAAIASGNAAAQTSFIFTTTSSSSTILTSFALDIFNPQEAVRTKVQSRSLSSDVVLYDYALDKANTSQFTGFQLDAATGTLTGTVFVYGCRT